MQIYEKFFNDTTERIYFIVFLQKQYSLTEKHGKSSLVTRCQARCLVIGGVVMGNRLDNHSLNSLKTCKPSRTCAQAPEEDCGHEQEW